MYVCRERIFMSERDVLSIYADAEQLSSAAAAYIVEKAKATIAEHGRFIIALTGGSTPRRLYQLLAASPWREQVEWSAWYIFVGDERVVPFSDAASNYGMAQQSLLAHVPVLPTQVYPVPTELGGAALVAERYEETILEVFGAAEHEWPRFDLILLGLGSDGHTASLFPGKPALDEAERLVVATPHGVLPPPVERVTLTFPVLNAARAVAFLVAGADKAEALRAAYRHLPLGDTMIVPAARVTVPDGELRWFVDEAAAMGLK